jgi:hypothetical protein
MPTSALVFTVGLAIFVLLFSALIAQFATKWIAGFKPRYRNALFSTIIGYVTVSIIRWVANFVGVPDATPRIFQLVFGLAVLTCSHIYLLRSAAGDRPTPGKAFLVSISQIVASAIFMLIVLYVLVGVKRLFA